MNGSGFKRPKNAPKNFKNTVAKFIAKHTREFCDKTSLHGLRYVTETGAHWFQSLLWASFVIAGAVFCCILMYLVWVRFSTNPTITAVETINYPVWNVPFPAVTICNVNKVHRPKIENVKNLLLSNNIDEETVMIFFKSLANLIVYQNLDSNFTEIFTILKNNKYTIEKLMLEVMQPCDKLLKRCTWMGTTVKCMDLFKTIKTDEGFCCSFNYHHTKEIFDKIEYSNKGFLDEYKESGYKENILSVAGAGIHTGLSVVLDVEDKEYMSATRIVPSVLVHVHETRDFAEMRILAMLVEKGELVQIPVDPSVVDTTNDVKALHRSKRNCIFEDEGYLSIGVYGYENCIIECRMNAIVDMCGCIPFYYNVKNYTYKPNIRFCEYADMRCISMNHRSFYTLHSEDVKTLGNTAQKGLKCKCFPTCDVNWYSYTMDVGHMIDSTEEFRASEVMVMHVYFAEFSCMKYKQSSLITWDGLFASFGGIFGLCLGGSLLSVVEIFYHFTIKMYMSFKTRNNVVVDVKQTGDSIDKTLLTIRDNQRKMMVLSKMNGFYGGVQQFPRKHNQLAVQPFRLNDNSMFAVDKFSQNKY